MAQYFFDKEELGLPSTVEAFQRAGPDAGGRIGPAFIRKGRVGMSPTRVLLVEDNTTWQTILETYIRMALPDSDLHVVATFQQGFNELNGRGWDLLVTDIGLPPDVGHVLGMQLVAIARKVKFPCIVVSGTESVTKQHVRDLLLGKDYQARDFFSKEELQSSPDKQRQFQELVRRSTVSRPGVPVPPGPSRKVRIGIRDDCLYLGADGLENLPIPKGIPERVFVFFVQNVATGLPAKVVPNEVLNQAVGAGQEDVAEPFLHKTIKQLNDRFRSWAHLPDDQRWVVKGSGEHGYCLSTTDVEWELAKELADRLRETESIYYLLVDPHRLQGNTPNRDQRLPARPSRNRPSGPGEDIDEES